MMKMRSVAAFLGITFALTACGGGGGRAVPGGLEGGSAPVGNGSRGNVQFTLTIPAAGSTSSSARRGAQTVSSQTESITVTVNGGTPQVFNVSSSICSGTPLTCTLTVGAPFGLDSFLVITYSGANGTGTALNAAALTFSVTSGGDNAANATAGNLLVVNSNADGSGGSYSCASGSTTCTLREAVAEASTTAGVFTAIMFQGVTSITVGSQITIGASGAQNIFILGPGAAAANTTGVGAPSASSQLTISGGGSSGIFLVNNGSLTVDGLTLSNGNNSDGYGGAIENYGSLAIVNTVFSNNTAEWEGGAVYDENTGSPESEIVASTFTGNTSEQGGGYYDEDGALFEASLFTSNVAYNSGDEYGEGGGIYGGWDLSVDGSVFTNNVAGSTSGANVSSGGYGGAISADASGGTQTITNSTFGGSASLGNFAGGTGAGDCGEGGAVDYYNDDENTLTTAGNTFNGNKAMGGAIGDCEYDVPYGAIGGALATEYGLLDSGDIGGPDTFTNNVADGTAGTGESGGGAAGGAVMVLDSSTWNGVTFSGNTAKGGSGTENDGGAVIADGTTFAATGATFSNNTSTATGSGGTYITGGGMAAFYTTLTLSSTTFTSNTANNGGAAFGGALATDVASHTFTTVTFTSNTASGSTVALGGGMLGYDSDGGGGCDEECGKHKRTPPASIAKFGTFAAKISSTTSQRRNSRHIALAKRHANSRHTAHHVASLRAPKALRRVPTVVASGGSGSTFSGVTFSNNTANGGSSGGGAFGGGAELSGTPAITGMTANGNTATVSGSGSYGAGGGISFSTTSCGEMTLTGSTISSNSAANAGGGLWNTCEAMVSQSTISGNIVTAPAEAEDGGGGIYNDGLLALVQSSVATNRVTAAFAGSGGGGVMNDDAELFALDSTIFNNTSATDGGGVENADYGYSFFLNATVAGNTASGKGGSIDNENESGSDEVDIQNSIIAGGSAPAGPEIANLDTFYSYGGNLIQGSVSGNAIPAASSPPNDLLGVNPQLSAAFTNNGGPTSTVAETASSPTIGALPFANGYCGNGGPNLDQRNYARGANGVCDIGAYEYNGTPSTATLTLPASVAPRMPQTLRSLFAR